MGYRAIKPLAQQSLDEWKMWMARIVAVATATAAERNINVRSPRFSDCSKSSHPHSSYRSRLAGKNLTYFIKACLI